MFDLPSSVRLAVLYIWLAGSIFLGNILPLQSQDRDRDGILDSIEHRLAHTYAPTWRFHRRSSCSSSAQNRDEIFFPASIEAFEQAVTDGKNSFKVIFRTNGHKTSVPVSTLNNLDATLDPTSGLLTTDTTWGNFGTESVTLIGYPRKLKGDPTHFPTYYRCWRDSTGLIYLAYFLFYPYDHKGYNIPLINTGDHRGDFEGINIALCIDEDSPYSESFVEKTSIEHIFYSGHGQQKFAWQEQVCFVDETHPQVYIAWGSHACYPLPGEWHGFKIKGPDIYDDMFHGTGLVVNSWHPQRQLINVGEVESSLVGWLGFRGRWGPDGDRQIGSPPGPPGKGFWKSGLDKRSNWSDVLKNYAQFWTHPLQTFPCSDETQVNLSSKVHPPLSIDLASPLADSQQINYLSSYFWDSTGEYSVEQIIELQNTLNWEPYQRCADSRRTNPGAYWVIFSLTNTSPIDSTNLFLQFLTDKQKKGFTWVEVFGDHSDTLTHQKTGNLTNIQDRAFFPNKNVVPIRLAPLESRSFYARLLMSRTYSAGFDIAILSPSHELTTRKNQIIADIPHYLFSFIFLSILIYFFVFSILQYAESQENSYFIYALFLITLIFYTLRMIAWDSETQDIISFSSSYILRWHFHIEVISVVPTYLLYLYFLYHLLEIKKHKPILHYLLLFTGLVWVMLIFVDMMVRNIWGIHTSMNAYNWYRAAFIPASMFLYYHTYKIPGRTPKYIITGGGFLLLSGFVTVLLRKMGLLDIDHLGTVFGRSTTYQRIGILLENLCYILALGHKVGLQLKEKSRLEEQIATAQLQALKAQMNPHFIFNSISAVTSFIDQQNNEKANLYLLKFSSLVRAVLDYSEIDSITLEKEILLCLDYISLQRMRFDESFDFSYIPDTALDLSAINVPPFILQPYLENSIEHGLRPKEGPKHLILQVEQIKNEVICTVEDNGIGRKAAALRKSYKPARQKSIGMRNTEDRIRLSNLQKKNIQLSITDKFTHRESSGTRILIKIPL